MGLRLNAQGTLVCAFKLAVNQMNPIGLRQAQSRLALAKRHLEELKSAAQASPEYESAWAAFVVSLNSVFAKLEQGAKSSPKSSAWFGRIKFERRRDPLLQYLHNARHSESHSLETGLSSTPPVMRDLKVIVNDGGKSINLKFNLLGSKSTLTTIENTQYGNKFDPPMEHMGKPLTDLSPLGIAALGFAYAERVVNDARDLDPT